MISQFLLRSGSPSARQRPLETSARHDRSAAWRTLAKSIEDKVIAAILLVVLSPVLALLALAVRLDSKGPVLFRQSRQGLDNQPFTCLKFRSMQWNPNAGEAIQQTCRDDDRITPVGRFIRKASLDELPQLFNVLRGEMSIVGPRPHAPSMRTEGLLCEEIIPDYRLRHSVKPGITGLAQIKGFRGATETIPDLRNRLEQDLIYVQTRSLALDMKILLMTPVTVLSTRNAF